MPWSTGAHRVSTWTSTAWNATSLGAILPWVNQRTEFGVAAGVAAERVRLQGWVPHEELLAGYAEIDIGLDPFPFSGGLTSCEALWSGVPVVTWAGDRMCGRQTAAFLSRVGLDDLVAGTREEYIERAVDLAMDGPRRAILRTELRGRMQDSPLCDARRLAEEFIEAVEEACRRLAVL